MSAEDAKAAGNQGNLAMDSKGRMVIKSDDEMGGIFKRGNDDDYDDGLGGP